MKKFSSYLIPSLIASVLMSMYAIVDGIFIGQKIGDSGLAAINICWPITAFLQSIGTTLGLAGGIAAQIFLAQKNESEANKIKCSVLLLSLILAIVFGVLFYFVRNPLLKFLGAKDISYHYAMSYIRVILIGSAFQVLGMTFIPLLRNSNRVKLAMTASLCSIFINLLLDYLFVFVLEYGLEGAAWGSVIAQMASSLFCFIVFLPNIKGICFKRNSILEIFKKSVAPFTLTYSYSIIIIITNLVCAYYGKDEAVAAYTLLSYLCYINIAISCAIADSIQPLFSYHHELKKYQENNKMLKGCFLISFLAALILAFIMIIFRRSLGDLYNLSDKAYSYYSNGIWYYAIGALLVSLIKVISSYFYSIDEKKFANIIILLEPFFFTPLWMLSFAVGFGLNGVWMSFLMVQLSLVILSFVLLYLKEKKFQIEYVIDN